MATGSDPRDLLAVIVYVQAKAECIDAFKAATVANATNSVQEKGCARFDVVQEQGDPTKFAIMEVFKTAEGPTEHKASPHYKAWADIVAEQDMMATPRYSVKYTNVCPGSASGWDVPLSLSSGSRVGSPKELLAVHVFVHVKEECIDAFKEATIANATSSVLEPGIARFDFIQQQDDPTKFVLVEVYCTESGPADHKETDHYAKWRDAVADMMAEPRTNIKYINCFPVSEEGWRSG